MSERDNKGRFLPGNKTSRKGGRPPRATEMDYLNVILGACSVEDWAEIVDRAVYDAKQGEPKAREWLTKYLIGDKPDLVNTIAAMESGGSEYQIDQAIKRLEDSRQSNQAIEELLNRLERGITR